MKESLHDHLQVKVAPLAGLGGSGCLVREHNGSHEIPPRHRVTSGHQRGVRRDVLLDQLRTSSQCSRGDSRIPQSPPLVPELPMWLKLIDYYAIFMIAWGMFVLVFSGETPEERAARWQLEQVSNLTLIHAGMVVIGLTYYGCLWLIAYRKAKNTHGINS